MDAGTKRIAGAFLVGGGLIALALVLGPDKSAAPEQVGLVAVASPSAAREYLPVSDNDLDGIPDWQEALQRTEPVVIEEIEEDYELPDTLTDRFSREFFQDMVRSRNYGEFGSSPDEVVNKAVDQFQDYATDDLYTPTDVTIINDNSPETIRSYVNALANIALDYPVEDDAMSPADILKLAYDTNNPEVLNQLDEYIRVYDEMVLRVRSLEVPSDYLVAHLDILNAMNAVYIDLTAMKTGFSDPLFTIVRLKRFIEDALSVQVTIMALQRQVIADGIEFISTDPVWQILAP